MKFKMRKLWLLLAPLMLASQLVIAPSAWADDEFDYFRAAQLDDAATLEKLLPVLGPNLREEQRGENGLILALRENAMRAFNTLLAAPGIDLELRANNGNTALMMAAYKDNLPAVQALLDKGAKVNQLGWTALHYAAAGGSAQVIRLLVKHRAELDARSPHMATALMLAAREGQEEAVTALLEAGANPALKNGEGLDAAAIAERADKLFIVAAIQAFQARAHSGK